MMSITIRLVMIELLHYFTMQVLFKISSKNYIAMIYVFRQGQSYFMRLNMKSISIVFPQHTNNGNKVNIANYIFYPEIHTFG